MTPDEFKAALKAFSEQVDKLSGVERRDATAAVAESAHWGRLAITYAFIFNAGALTFLPRVAGEGFLGPIAADGARLSAWLFGLGALAAALTCLFAYINFQIAASMYWKQGDAAGYEANHAQFGDADSLAKGRDARKAANRRRWHLGWTNWTALALGILTWALFVWGSIRLVQ